MRKQCGTDYNQGAGCGVIFDDAERMTLCPHPPINDPNWRTRIERYEAAHPRLAPTTTYALGRLSVKGAARDHAAKVAQAVQDGIWRLPLLEIDEIWRTFKPHSCELNAHGERHCWHWLHGHGPDVLSMEPAPVACCWCGLIGHTDYHAIIAGVMPGGLASWGSVHGDKLPQPAQPAQAEQAEQDVASRIDTPHQE